MLSGLRSVITCLVIGISITGCTSTFEPRLTAGAIEQPRLPSAKTVQSGIEVSVEEYFSSHKSRRAFDADIGASGVLPLLVYIENKGGQEY
jgi:hypothetical protein